MNTSDTAPTRIDAINEVSKWGVGTGIVLFALFPLSIPILILTAVALLPLAVPLIAIGLLAAPVLLARALWRRFRGRGGGRGVTIPVSRPAGAGHPAAVEVQVR